MTNAIKLFEYNGSPSRTIVIDGETFWVAKDVCEIIGIKYHRSAIQKLDQSFKGVHPIDSPGGIQKMAIINLHGLNRLLMNSRKEKAAEYQDWVLDKVLPQILETGSYSVTSETSDVKALTAKVRELSAKIDAFTAAKPYLVPEIAYTTPSEPVPEISYRSRINTVVRSFATRHHIEYKIIWNKFYQLFRDTYHIDAKKTVAYWKSQGISTMTHLGVIEDKGKIREAYDLALSHFPYPIGFLDE